MAAGSPIIAGKTTILWGTLGKLRLWDGRYWVAWDGTVESISVTKKHGDPIGDIEDGNGAGVSLILLDDGFSAKVRCIYDTALTWPSIGGAMELTLLGVAHACTVASLTPDLARKREVKMEINLVYRPGIDPAMVDP